MISIKEFKPRKAQWGFRCNLDKHIIANMVFLNNWAIGNPHELASRSDPYPQTGWWMERNVTGPSAEIIVYTNDKEVAGRLRIGLDQ